MRKLYLNIKVKFKELYKKESFNPSILSVFINPFFFTRKGLYKGIKSNTKYMNGTMLDFGCGSKPYKNLFKVKEYVGLDTEESGHNHRNEEIDVLYNGKQIPFVDNCFDSLFSSQVFEHVSCLSETLDEIHRVMKPGANLLITLPFVWDEHEIPYDYIRYTSFGVRHLLEAKGFSIICTEKTTNYVETVCQMWNAYVFQFLLPSNQYIKLLLTPLLIAPMTVLGMFLSKVLPNNKNFYCDNIVVCRCGKS